MREYKLELEKMKSLMGRMDKHLTLNEAEEETKVIEEEVFSDYNKNNFGRINYQSFDDMINDLDFKGSFVGLGYVEAYDVKKIYPNAEGFRDSFEREITNIDITDPLSTKLRNFRNDNEYYNPTGAYATKGANKGLRSMYNKHFIGILKITHYVINWGNGDSWSNWTSKIAREKANLRKDKYGFGNDPSTYAADDWRRKLDKKGISTYDGLGAYPKYTPKRFNDSSKTFPVQEPYKANSENPFAPVYYDTDTYGVPQKSYDKDGNEYQKRALRFTLSSVNNGGVTYYLIDINGDLNKISESTAKFFYETKVRDHTKPIDDTMCPEEINYIKDMGAIDNKLWNNERKWIIDNILYIKGEGISRRTGEKLLGRWINKTIPLKFNLNPKEYQQAIDDELKRVKKN